MKITNGQILLQRLQKLAKNDYNNPEEVKRGIEEIRESWAKDNYHTAGEDLELELSYEVKKRG